MRLLNISRLFHYKSQHTVMTTLWSLMLDHTSIIVAISLLLKEKNLYHSQNEGLNNMDRECEKKKDSVKCYIQQKSHVIFDHKQGMSWNPMRRCVAVTCNVYGGQLLPVAVSADIWHCQIFFGDDPLGSCKYKIPWKIILRHICLGECLSVVSKEIAVYICSSCRSLRLVEMGLV